MNGLSYEQMWLLLRHKAAQQEGPGVDQEGKMVFGPCQTLIRSMEETSLFPKQTVEAEKVDGEPPLPPAYGGIYPDFRLMWFTLVHTAEAGPLLFPGLRDWMVEIEDEQISAAVDPLAHLADTMMQIYQLTKSEKGGAKKAPDVSGFPETEAFRLSSVASDLIKAAGDLMKLREAIGE